MAKRKWIAYVGPEPKVSFNPETGESSDGHGPYLKRGVPVEVPAEVAKDRCFEQVVEYERGGSVPKSVSRPSADWREVEMERPALEFTPSTKLTEEVDKAAKKRGEE